MPRKLQTFWWNKSVQRLTDRTGEVEEISTYTNMHLNHFPKLISFTLKLTEDCFIESQHLTSQFPTVRQDRDEVNWNVRVFAFHRLSQKSGKV